MTLSHRPPRLVIPATLCCALATGAILRAQGPPDPAPASLAGVIAELRQLRAAVEESNHRQSRIQMLSVSLGPAEPVVETANRLEATRRQLSEAVAWTGESLRVVKMFEGDPTDGTPSTFPSEAAGLVEMFKPQVDAAKQREDQLRARETEMVQALQVEEARPDETRPISWCCGGRGVPAPAHGQPERDPAAARRARGDAGRRAAREGHAAGVGGVPDVASGAAGAAVGYGCPTGLIWRISMTTAPVAPLVTLLGNRPSNTTGRPSV